MALNRAQVDNLAAVAAMCQATESSKLGKVIVNFRSVLQKEKALLDSSAIELPPECVDILTQAASTAGNVISMYEEKGSAIATANRQMNDIILRTMGRAQSTGADATNRMSSATRTMDDVKGGVKL